MDKQEKKQDYDLRKKHGISLEDYRFYLEGQGGRCAVCECRPRGKNFAVDHDHVTGHLRGLLCQTCNMRLGKYGDNPTDMEREAELLVMGAAYLRRNG